MSVLAQHESRASELDYDHHLSVGMSRKRAKSYPADEESSFSTSLPISSAGVSPSMSPPREEPDLEVWI